MLALVDLSTGAALIGAVVLIVVLLLGLVYLDYRRICRRCDERVRHPKAEPVDYAAALRPTRDRRAA